MKNNFEFKKKIENLIITLENNVEHFDKQKSFFIYKAPLFSDETINLYNVNNKIPTTYNHDANEYDRIVRTKPIIKQLKQLLNILNLDSSYILDKSDVLK